MKKKLLQWVFKNVVKKATPFIVDKAGEFLREAIDDLEKKADATPNPYDNVLVDLLKAILNATAK